MQCDKRVVTFSAWELKDRAAAVLTEAKACPLSDRIAARDPAAKTHAPTLPEQMLPSVAQHACDLVPSGALKVAEGFARPSAVALQKRSSGKLGSADSTPQTFGGSKGAPRTRTRSSDTPYPRDMGTGPYRRAHKGRQIPQSR